MTDDIAPSTAIQTLPRGQKAGQNLTLYAGRVMPETFGQVVEYAQMMCKAGLAIPKHLRENPGACLSVIQRSLAWEMDPWAVATKTYSVNDILAYESQLIAAVVRKWAPIKERVIPYKYEGSLDEMSCSITLHHAETGEEIFYQSPKIKDISPRNSPLWKVDRQQQLGYYTVRALARRHFPEILLGVYDREEVMAMKDITPPQPVENFLHDEDVHEPAAEVLPPASVAEAPAEEPAEEPLITDEMVINNILKAVASCKTMADLNEVEKLNAKDIKALPEAARKAIRKAIADKSVEVEL